MHRVLLFICILFFNVTTYFVQAQPSALLNKKIIFSQLPEKLGLSEPTINCIIQDHTGYLWIGTWSGLIRYDGYSTKTYYSNSQSPHSLKSNKIISLLQDKEGFIWIGTHKGGLFKFDPVTEKFQQFKYETRVENSLSNDNIWALLEDKDGRIWIGTEKGLNIYDKKSGLFAKYFTSPTDSKSIGHNFITDIHQSQSGNIWIATEYGFNKAIVKGKEISFKKYFYNPESNNAELHNYFYRIEDLTIDGEETIWLSTKRGIKKLMDEQIFNYEIEGRASGYNLFRALATIEGDQPLVLAGSETGLNVFNAKNNTFTKLLINSNDQANLTHGTVTSIYIDQSKVLWVGTKKGINKFDTYSKDFNFFKTQNFDQTESIITGIRESNPGTYWIATMGGGIYRYRQADSSSNSKFKKFKIRSNLNKDFTDFIQSLYTDAKGNIWVGTAGDGVYRFNENKINPASKEVKDFDHYYTQSDKPISDDYIMSIGEDDQNSIWLGTWSGGLTKISTEGKVTCFKDSILIQAPLVAIYKDNETLWIGSRGNGLLQVKRQDENISIVNYNAERGLTNLFVNSIYKDNNGLLWVGTEDGLYFKESSESSFRRYDLHNEMEKEVIVGILGDHKGKLWLSHWEGITVISPYEGTEWVRHYDRQDHIQGGFFYNNNCIKSSDGNLVFAGSNGFNIIDPEKGEVNPVKAKVAIKEFLIHNKGVKAAEEFNGRIIIEKDWTSEKIELTHFENSLSFEFAALHYAAPDKIKYAHKLEGFEDDWQYNTASRRFANYTNLPAGDYKFLVKATNNDGIWGEEVSSLSFTILPPWWKTEWAIMGYVVVFIIILFLFRQIIIIRTSFIHELKLERLEKQNIENINKAKLEFFTNISHEFRTPLTLILGPLERVKDAVIADKDVRHSLNVIDNNAQRLLRLINQLLDFRKVESGKFKLLVGKGNIVKFVKEIKLSFEAAASQKHINFKLKADKDNISAWFDRDQFEKILFNLISNAIKNTPEDGSVTISVSESSEEVEISVSDTGIGIEPENLENIFERFYSSKDHKKSPGTGIGLALTKSLVELHGGHISVLSHPHESTTFKVKIPKGNSHFNTDEIVYDFQDSEHLILYPEYEKEALETSNEIIGFEKNERSSKILIVEDNSDVRNYIKSIFVRHYIVLEAGNGQEGIDIATEELPEAIISDVMMPVMDGINMCKKLKKDIRTSHIPIILLTARTPLIFKVEGLETGADDYITKPFEPKTLELKVKNSIKLRQAIRNVFTDKNILEIEPSKVTLTSADETFINKSLESIEKNMDNSDYTVEDLAEDVCLSRMQLYRKIKSLTGQSANEFIRTIRLKRAAQLLEQNQLTVSEVTYQVGFNDLKYFRACFKKQFGVNPSSYASSYTKNPPVESS